MRYLRYIILFSSIVLAPLNNLFADDPIKFLHRPIIFLHGIQTPPKPENGWPTWNNPNSAMMKIINSEYSGYKAGVPLNCCKDSILYTMPDSKRIYNFSYYNPDGSRGVIGNNVNDTTEKENNPSFWRKLSYGIGYEGGICYTGPDLKRYVHGYSYDFTTILYWLNSIEVSITYPVKDGKGIEVGGGVNYAKLPQRDFSNAYWDFRNFQGSIKVLKNKVSFGLIGYYSWIRKVDKRYEDTDNNPYTPGEFVGYDVYSGRGKGFAIIFKIYHKWRHGKFGVSFTLGSIKCKVESISHFETLSLNGIHLFWNWRISEKGGIK